MNLTLIHYYMSLPYFSDASADLSLLLHANFLGRQLSIYSTLFTIYQTLYFTEQEKEEGCSARRSTPCKITEERSSIDGIDWADDFVLPLSKFSPKEKTEWLV